MFASEDIYGEPQCTICEGVKEHKPGCMYRTATVGPHGEVLRDPLRGRTITDLESMVEKRMGADMLPIEDDF